VRRHLLVTNDFPPKVGGIQSYLWELWRRLPPQDTTVYCTPHEHAVSFDARQEFRVERSPEPVLLPYPWLVRRVRDMADDVGAELIMLDPAVPLGIIGPLLDRPYGVVLHGAEVTIPGRLPVVRGVLRRVLRGASLVVAAGDYALTEAERCAGRALPAVVIPPGVDTSRFTPFDGPTRSAARDAFGFGVDDVVIASVNRLVPRKGMDVLIDAVSQVARIRPQVRLVIGGTGRTFDDLNSRAARSSARIELLGRLDDAEVPRLYGAADVMAMLCHDRWGGLEQEGFGIVFLEAAACGLPQVAGRSGGAAEAVSHERTGIVVDEPTSTAAVVSALLELIDHPEKRQRLGAAARQRACDEFDYDVLAARLERAIDDWTPPAS
jgi:phosphatidylinositol alpha-1,6-mannosyltransferase